MKLDLFGNKIKKSKKRHSIASIDTKYKAHIYLWSGGKDSTVMVDKALRNGDRVDYILFSDTKVEFEEMYEYVVKVSDYWKRRYGKKITVLRTEKEFEDIIFNIRGENGRKCTNKDNQGKISGLLNPSAGFCEWRSRSKIIPFENFLKQNDFNDDEVLVHIGFTIDEPNRTKRHKHEAYPLIDEYRMRESDCKQYLINNEMENPLYRHFNRTGCKFCPYQSEQDYYNIWKYYPDDWKEYKDIEKRVKEHEREAISSAWFINFQTCVDMENKFKKWQILGFEPNNEPLKNCFCKI
ncbi:conserved domain protein [hydrothermal vent metagenome]|uniref:Conserved domain protein n=1 Tax=hydrothermal vent metagenome TaxID=652676 RepID=A0A1W1D0U5_9ZZZZ